MVDVVYSDESLIVLGGPEQVNVEVDFGPQGDRGSRIYVGNGKPDNVDIGQTPNTFDVYINLLPSSDEYLNIYQYMEVLGTNQWETISRLNFNNYSEKKSIDFSTEINYAFIPTSAVLSNPSYIGNLNASNYNVQVTFEASAERPIAHSIKTELVPAAGVEPEKLKITFYVKEFNGTNWVTPDGSRTANISISVV
jgi:hypothetical protein